MQEPLILGALASGEIKSFTADLYLGHFERQGINLGPLAVEVRTVVFSKSLEAHPLEKRGLESYLFFGANGDYYVFI